MRHQRLISVAKVDGSCALALVLAKLRGADIWATADIFHATGTLSHYAIALGGARVWVLEKDAKEAFEVLDNGPPLASSGLRGWRAVLFVFILFQTGAGPSPFAVYLQKPRPAAASGSNA